MLFKPYFFLILGLINLDIMNIVFLFWELLLLSLTFYFINLKKSSPYKKSKRWPSN